MSKIYNKPEGSVFSAILFPSEKIPQYSAAFPSSAYKIIEISSIVNPLDKELKYIKKKFSLIPYIIYNFEPPSMKHECLLNEKDYRKLLEEARISTTDVPSYLPPNVDASIELVK